MPLKFRKILVADERYESAGVFDVDNDGVPDIVSGAYWYKGPDFKQAFRIGDVQAAGEYFDDFSTLPMDVNGDGYTDFITGGWWGNTLRWRQNPGAEGGDWKTHIIAEVGNVETTRAWDVDGDGDLEIVPNTPGGPLVIYKLIRDAAGKETGEFSARTIWSKSQGQRTGFWGRDGIGQRRFQFSIMAGWRRFRRRNREIGFTMRSSISARQAYRFWWWM